MVNGYVTVPSAAAGAPVAVSVAVVFVEPQLIPTRDTTAASAVHPSERLYERKANFFHRATCSICIQVVGSAGQKVP